MSVPSATWRSDFHLILPHPTEPRILMLSGEDGWSLPHIRLDKHMWLPAIGHIVETMRHDLGIHVSVLCCVETRIDREITRRIDAIYTLENHRPAWQPATPL